MWDKCSPRCGTLLTLETLNSRWCRQSDRPEVQMRYWGLLRMWKTKLESLFSSRRLTTCVSEVVFSRWVVIHFFVFCWTCRGRRITFQCFWGFLEVSWRNWSFYLLKNFLLFYSHSVSWNHESWKNNESKHLLLSFMFIWPQTEYCRISDVLQGQVAITVMAWFSFGRHK